MTRTIFHVDMDAFYASIEQRDRPEYLGKPVVVGADPKGGQGRGVVAACSYEARRAGIHSAMPIGRAYRLCPQAVYLRPDFKKYSEVSRQIRDIFRSFTDSVEVISIDEAFLDMSRAANEENAVELARSLKRRIRDEQQLTSSIGIAPNKFVAKIASDIEKPNGLVLVRAEEVQDFLDPLPISRLWGVGPKTEARLAESGIKTILQVRHYDRAALIQGFGKLGEHVWRLANGIDDRPVVSHRDPKSIGHETTFAEDVSETQTLEETLERLSRSVAERLLRHGFAGKTVTLKLRYSDFTTITRQITSRRAVQAAEEISPIAVRLLHKFRDTSRRIRLIGVSVSSFESCSAASGPLQLALF